MPIATAKPITFKVGQETFALRLGFNAACRIEEELDQSFMAFAQTMAGGDMRFSHLLTVFHALMLRDMNGGSAVAEDVSRDEAAAIVDELGAAKVGELIAQAFEASPLFAKPARQKVRGANVEA